MSFNLNCPKFWRPFYSESFPLNFLPSVQEHTLLYAEPNIELADEIQDEITFALKNKIRSQRKKMTSFVTDTIIQARLLVLLTQLESARLDRVDQIGCIIGDCIDSLQILLRRRKMYGYPMHFIYTRVEDIVSTVSATEVGLAKHTDA